MRKMRLQFAVLVGCLLFCLPGFAQLNLGRIYGSITDQTGGAIVGGTVNVVDVARGITHPLTTDAAGEFSASSLLPGMYTVRAEAMGFQTTEHTGLVLEVGQDLRVDLSLQPGAQNQTVTVTGELPIINTTNATLGGTVENQTILDLPINGRAFQKLLDYSPGMQAVPGGSTPTYFSNGNRAMNNTWMFDGVDDINITAGAGPVIGGNGGGVDGITILPLDAIQEINAIESPKPEFGWKPGAQVNIGLKSGTNDLHGTALAFGRDGALDAKNPFLGPNLSKATDNLEQYGVSIGGPIKKDKLFYFGAYEGQSYTLGAPKTITEPTTAAGLGAANSFPNAIAALEVPGPTGPGYCNPAAAGCAKPLSQLSLNMAGCTLPAGLTGGATCNAANGLFGNASSTASYPVAFSNFGGSQNGMTKLDYHLNDHNAINGEYYFGQGHVDNAVSAAQPYWLDHYTTRAQAIRAVWVWTPNTTWVNEMRFGYMKVSQTDAPSDCSQNLGQPNYAAAFGLNTGLNVPPPECGFPNLTISGGGVTDSALGDAGGSGNQHNVNGSWAGIDSVSYTRGKHLFKFGGEIHASPFSGNVSVLNQRGTLAFGGVSAFTGATALEDFLTGLPSSSAVLLGDVNRDIVYYRYSAFVQDDWRLTQRLTANIGVRWEYVPPIMDANNQLANFDPTTPSGLIQQGNGVQLFKNPWANFSPRLGLAWDVTGKGTTVIRLGGSYIYDSLILLDNYIKTPQGAQLNTIPTGFTLVLPNGTAIAKPGNIAVGTVTTSGGLSGGNSIIPWAVNAPIFNATTSGLTCGNGLGSVNLAIATNPLTNPANPAPCSISGIQHKWATPGVVSWNLAVQHAFTNNLSLNIAYVGTHGTDLPGVIDLNQPSLGAKNGTASPTNENEQLRRPYTANCPAAEGGQGLGGPCFPYLGTIDQESANLISNYNGLQVGLQQRLSHGLSFTVGYTFAHSLDDNSSEVSNEVMDSLNPGLDYGNSTFDARNHATLVATYDIPGLKAPGQLLEGWQVNGTVNLLTPLPFNAADTSSDVSGTGEALDRWSIAGPPSNMPGGAGSIPCYGVIGSSFASAGCLTVGSVTNLPALCQTTAAAEPLSPVGTGVLTTFGTPATGQTTQYGQNTGTYSLARLGCYFENSTAIVPPAQGTYGDMSRDALRGHPFRETDISVTKSWKFRELLTAQFRAEFFNIFNSAEYAVPAGNPNSPATFGRSASTPNTSSLIFGNGGPRTVQLGLKLIF